ncbi:hypothetical protein CASFOL_013400 [Castilleja foliolosa]|uniref:Uncharacterized protein n=1 Tax=Castilleja foliolosa TaxID=1961234 RepID=A0ABD3DJU7_9LAMI
MVLVVGPPQATRISPRVLPSAVRRRRPGSLGNGRTGSFRATSPASLLLSSLE